MGKFWEALHSSLEWRLERAGSDGLYTSSPLGSSIHLNNKNLTNNFQGIPLSFKKLRPRNRRIENRRMLKIPKWKMKISVISRITNGLDAIEIILYWNDFFSSFFQISYLQRFVCSWNNFALTLMQFRGRLANLLS